MKIFRNILKVISLIAFVILLLHGSMLSLYFCSFFFFLVLYFFKTTDKIEKKLNVRLTTKSNIYRIIGLIFIYLCLYEKDLNVYNILCAIICTTIYWLFIVYINLNIKNIKKNRKKNKDE